MLKEKLAEIYVDITGRLGKLRGALSSARNMVNRASQRLGRMAKRFALAAGVAIAAGIAFAVKAAMRQEEALTRLDVALRSTGHAAKLTKEELVEHAKALQKITVYGDEAIQEMQALLLTFVNIRGEIFKRTTKAILNVSSAMKQELVPTALQLGKALNDPILGLTMLRRVGISFSDEQVKTIKALWNTGQEAKAQTLILDELKQQFGGMSEVITTARGRLRQLWNVIGDVAERVGNLLIPKIKEVALRTKDWFVANENLIALKADAYFSKVGLALGFLAGHIKKITYAMGILVAVLIGAKAVTIGIGLKALIVFLLANPVALVLTSIAAAFTALYAAIALGATKAERAMNKMNAAYEKLGRKEDELRKKREQVIKLRKLEESLSLSESEVKLKQLQQELAAASEAEAKIKKLQRAISIEEQQIPFSLDEDSLKGIQARIAQLQQEIKVEAQKISLSLDEDSLRGIQTKIMQLRQEISMEEQKIPVRPEMAPDQRALKYTTIRIKRLRQEIELEKESIRLGEAQLILRRQERHAEVIVGREVIDYSAFAKGQQFLREQITKRETLVKILGAELEATEAIDAARKREAAKAVTQKEVRAAEQKKLERREDILRELGYEKERRKVLEKLWRTQAADYKKFLGDKYNEDEIYNRLKEKAEKKTAEKTKLERLHETAEMYRSMKGYDKEYQKTQRAIWREQAKEYAKTGLVTAEEAFAGLVTKAKEPLNLAVEQARIGLVGFEQAWAQITTGARQTEKAQLKETQKQTPYLKSIAEDTRVIKNKKEERGFGP